jgi:hypothetical protein
MTFKGVGVGYLVFNRLKNNYKQEDFITMCNQVAKQHPDKI